MEAAKLIDTYGAYVDIYECLVSAGKIRSKLLVEKVVSVAKYDGRHAEALKALRKAKVLLFYEPVSQCFRNKNLSFTHSLFNSRF